MSTNSKPHEHFATQIASIEDEGEFVRIVFRGPNGDRAVILTPGAYGNLQSRFAMGPLRRVS
jgi:hypothetical protein